MGKTSPAPMFVLRERLLQLGRSQAAIARALGISGARLSMLLNGKCGISPEMALRLGLVLNTPPEYWLKLQMQHDLSQALERHGRDLQKLEPLGTSLQVAAARARKAKSGSAHQSRAAARNTLRGGRGMVSP